MQIYGIYKELKLLGFSLWPIEWFNRHQKMSIYIYIYMVDRKLNRYFRNRVLKCVDDPS